MKAACIGARIISAPPVDILPRHKPYLHKIQPKDPVELENGGYVSRVSVCQYNITSTMNNRQNFLIDHTYTQGLQVLLHFLQWQP